MPSATEGGEGREQSGEARLLLRLKLGTTVLNGPFHSVLIFRERKHQQNPFYFEIIKDSQEFAKRVQPVPLCSSSGFPSESILHNHSTLAEGRCCCQLTCRHPRVPGFSVHSYNKRTFILQHVNRIYCEQGREGIQSCLLST